MITVTTVTPDPVYCSGSLSGRHTHIHTLTYTPFCSLGQRENQSNVRQMLPLNAHALFHQVLRFRSHLEVTERGQSTGECLTAS